MKKKLSRPIGIDLFAGAGGLSLGFEQAGFDLVASVEIDPVHAAVHKFNFPECQVITRSVTDLRGSDIRRAAGIGDKKVDVVFGGAPCQGFSLMGQRALDDPRNALVRDFVRIVHELDATFFVFENVKGLTLGRHKEFLSELIEAFQSVGYSVRTEWRVLNAYSYGVPQDRERLFLLGAKAGNVVPEYPRAFTQKAGGKANGLPYGPSCKDALGDIPDAESFKALLESDKVVTSKWMAPSAYGALMRCIDKDGWAFGYQREWDPRALTSSLRTTHTPISRRRFAETAPGSVEPISRFFRLPPDGVSNTLRAGTDSARGAFTSPRPIHYKHARCITVREMARLHGFPDWFRFNETKWHGARQIGNAVPPPLAKAVAQEVMRALGVKPERPRKVVRLGADELLRMGMTEASEYWGIQAPIARRDRKSGVRKRTQFETEKARLSLK
tara:strand:+ start:14829 stop:16157 length:1329 start_codon:yes stop_codon:yes gene_type:complete